jgi:hypothetical protein
MSPFAFALALKIRLTRFRLGKSLEPFRKELARCVSARSLPRLTMSSARELLAPKEAILCVPITPSGTLDEGCSNLNPRCRRSERSQTMWFPNASAKGRRLGEPEMRFFRAGIRRANDRRFPVFRDVKIKRRSRSGARWVTERRVASERSEAFPSRMSAPFRKGFRSQSASLFFIKIKAVGNRLPQ